MSVMRTWPARWRRSGGSVPARARPAPADGDAHFNHGIALQCKVTREAPRVRISALRSSPISSKDFSLGAVPTARQYAGAIAATEWLAADAGARTAYRTWARYR
jgi:hypothetical protein